MNDQLQQRLQIATSVAALLVTIAGLAFATSTRLSGRLVSRGVGGWALAAAVTAALAVVFTLLASSPPHLNLEDPDALGSAMRSDNTRRPWAELAPADRSVLTDADDIEIGVLRDLVAQHHRLRGYVLVVLVASGVSLGALLETLSVVVRSR
ncbi:MAG TPA: hypothetical protein VJ777_01895 [Mycobacterium sp.]|nr:hypothetical protein [Mycobacterium sp.]